MCRPRIIFPHINRALKKSRRDECFQPATSVAGKKPNKNASPVGTAALENDPKFVFQRPAKCALKRSLSRGVAIYEKFSRTVFIMASCFVLALSPCSPCLRGESCFLGGGEIKKYFTTETRRTRRMQEESLSLEGAARRRDSFSSSFAFGPVRADAVQTAQGGDD